MNKTINTPETVQDLLRTARELGLKASDLLGLIKEEQGLNWPDSEPQEITIKDATAPAAEDWNPHLNEWQRPGPGVIPSGFEPFDSSWNIFVGKSMEGARWKVLSEYVLDLNEFSLTFWTTDDDPMTADETREYTNALLEMASYITTMGNIMATGVEVTK